MAFFRTVTLSEQLPAIVGDRVVLRAPQMSDYAEWAALREASRDFLTPWEPTWPPDDLTRGSFRRRIKRYTEDQRSDLAYPFFVFRKHDSVLVGGLTLANIRRGCAQTGNLGYWTGAAHARQGYMTAAVAQLPAVRLPDAAAASHRGCLHPGQCGLDPPPGEDRISARGIRPRISVHRRGVAGPSALCPPQARPAALSDACDGGQRPWGRHGSLL